MTEREPIVMQVYCRVKVVVDDPAAMTEVAVRRLREADIDWSAEADTLAEAEAEMRTDLPQALSSLVDPAALLAGVPGVEISGGRWWAEPGEPAPGFQPGFPGPAPRRTV
ncbi:hypothetical protein ACWT_2957 [Actinoplanes sp. SE50]|uniref:hypothetical protein n=1 Tax=unclassified Actinoplanes TaxID=2626549 RepID=UPI00023EBED9|nr:MULTISPECIES: hypothetical protein [unclassified Actinoplanes]AEV83485.1 hypothetical protein ACPL_2590 [Actinoplanes sp. SE50/110]ATO82372.1 hypothetical protein ACWT_2957 [Actinoplanes sp. SE50]SLL99779.1 hypothetical protein ACSP50_3010 [Actinoplanes sp. SE50/110]